MSDWMPKTFKPVEEEPAQTSAKSSEWMPSTFKAVEPTFTDDLKDWASNEWNTYGKHVAGFAESVVNPAAIAQWGLKIPAGISGMGGVAQDLLHGEDLETAMRTGADRYQGIMQPGEEFLSQFRWKQGEETEQALGEHIQSGSEKLGEIGYDIGGETGRSIGENLPQAAMDALGILGTKYALKYPGERAARIQAENAAKEAAAEAAQKKAIQDAKQAELEAEAAKAAEQQKEIELSQKKFMDYMERREETLHKRAHRKQYGDAPIISKEFREFMGADIPEPGFPDISSTEKPVTFEEFPEITMRPDEVPADVRTGSQNAEIDMFSNAEPEMVSSKFNPKKGPDGKFRSLYEPAIKKLYGDWKVTLPTAGAAALAAYAFNEENPEYAAAAISLMGAPTSIHRMGGFSGKQGQLGMVRPEVFKEGLQNAVQALSDATDKLAVRYPKHVTDGYMKNPDGTPQLLIHGTRKNIPINEKDWPSLKTDEFDLGVHLHDGVVPPSYFASGANRVSSGWNMMRSGMVRNELEINPEGNTLFDKLYKTVLEEPEQNSPRFYVYTPKKGRTWALSNDYATWDDPVRLALKFRDEKFLTQAQVERVRKAVGIRYTPGVDPLSFVTVRRGWEALRQILKEDGVRYITYPNKYEGLPNKSPEYGTSWISLFPEEDLVSPWDMGPNSLDEIVNPNAGKFGQGGGIGGWKKKPDAVNRKKAALRLENNPDFIAFRDSLPDPAKKYAAHAWAKHVNRTFNDAFIDTFWKNAVINNTPEAIRGTLRDELGTRIAPLNELKKRILTEGDIGDNWFQRFGQNLVSGIESYAFANQNTVLRAVSDMMNEADRGASAKITRWIDKNLRKKLERHVAKDQGIAMSILRENEGVRDVTLDILKNEYKVTGKLAETIMEVRKILDEMFEENNRIRQLKGLDPIEKRPGYFPARRIGNYAFRVTDAEGKLIYFGRATSRRHANKIRESLKARFADEDITVGEVEVLKRGKISSMDALDNWDAILQTVGKDDPRAGIIKGVVSEYLENQGLDAYGYPKHFKIKGGIEGAEGFKYGLDDIKNAKEGFNSLLRYVEQGAKWQEIQKVQSQVHGLLNDVEVREKMPNATRFAQTAWDDFTGKGNQIGNAIDLISDNFVPINTLYNVVGGSKAFAQAAFLGYLNTTFLLSQFLQPIQMGLPWMQYIASHVGEGKALDAFSSGMAETVGYLTDKLNVKAGGKPKIASQFLHDAIAWADENKVTRSHILDDIRDASMAGKVSKIYHAASTGSLTLADTFTRTQVFGTFASALHKIMPDVPAKEIYSMAAKATDMMMVDYRTHMKAGLYKNLGWIGQSASALTTFKHNQFSQLYGFAKRGGMKHPEILGTALATQLMFGGLLGYYAFEEADGIVNLLNRSGLFDKRIQTPSEWVLENVTDNEKLGKLGTFLSHGGISSITGIDMSSKFSAGNLVPDSLLQGVAPVAGYYADASISAMKLAKSRDEAAFMEFLHKTLPTSVKWIPEKMATREAGTPKMSRDQYAQGVEIRRTPEDWQARVLGGRTMRESTIKDRQRTQTEITRFENEMRNKTSNNMKLALQEKNYDKLKENAMKYMQNGGKPDGVVSVISTYAKNKDLTPEERNLLSQWRNPFRVKRIYEDWQKSKGDKK